MWNPDNTPPREFYDVLGMDEGESGSEMEESEDEGGSWEHVVADANVHVEDMPIFNMAEDGSLQPLIPESLTSTTHSPPMQTTNVRDRSPLRPPVSPYGSSRSPSPPPYSPLSSPIHTVEFWEEPAPAEVMPTVEMAPAVEFGPVAAPSTVRGRGQARTRGVRSGPRGGVSARGRRVASRAVNEATGWRRGERILEVCLSDEDVPPRLREMVYDLESSRRDRCAQQMRRRRIIRENDDDESDDEYHDAESFMAHELFGGDSAGLKFEWSPMSSFNGQAEEFQPQHTGPTRNSLCAYDAFRQYWDDEILEHIVRETNRYASDLKSSCERFSRHWYDTNVHEVLILFSFWMMIGIIRMPSIKSCFSNHPLLKTSIFRILMTENRYWILNRALHFVDNSTRTSDSSKLFCLGPVADHLNRKFMECYVPNQNITIDESLTLWKGHLSFRQYIKTKAARFGIKTFELCESMTGYLWSFIVYTGKEGAASSSNRLPKSTETVIQLIKPLLNKGYRLFLDNWFTSPILARFLKINQTDCVGTLRKNRKNVPALIQLATLPEGACIARHSGDVVVMAYHDKKPVYTISTCHGTNSVLVNSKPGRPSQYKPAVIADYNKSMGGVDKKDQMLEPYLLERKKNRKWYKKLFKRLLNVSIFNSRILVDRSTDSLIQQQTFRLQLVDAIVKRHLALVPQPRQRHTVNRHSDLPDCRLTGSHYIVRASVDGDQLTNANPANRSSKNRRNCLWCLVRENRYKKSVYVCDQCNVPLCLDGCFKKFHTVL